MFFQHLARARCFRFATHLRGVAFQFLASFVQCRHLADSQIVHIGDHRGSHSRVLARRAAVSGSYLLELERSNLRFTSSGRRSGDLFYQ